MKALGLPVLEKKNFEISFLFSYVDLLTCDHRGGVSFDPGGMISTNLVEVLKEVLYTKCQSSRPSRFREEEF